MFILSLLLHLIALYEIIECAALMHFEYNTLVGSKEYFCSCQCPTPSKFASLNTQWSCSNESLAETSINSVLDQFCNCLLNTCVCNEIVFQYLQKRAGVESCFGSSSSSNEGSMVTPAAATQLFTDLAKPETTFVLFRDKVSSLNLDPSKFLPPDAANILTSELKQPTDLSKYTSLNSLSKHEVAIAFAGDFIKLDGNADIPSGQSVEGFAKLLEKTSGKTIFEKLQDGQLSLELTDNMLKAAKEAFPELANVKTRIEMVDFKNPKPVSFQETETTATIIYYGSHSYLAYHIPHLKQLLIMDSMAFTPRIWVDFTAKVIDAPPDHEIYVFISKRQTGPVGCKMFSLHDVTAVQRFGEDKMVPYAKTTGGLSQRNDAKKRMINFANTLPAEFVEVTQSMSQLKDMDSLFKSINDQMSVDEILAKCNAFKDSDGNIKNAIIKNFAANLQSLKDKLGKQELTAEQVKPGIQANLQSLVTTDKGKTPYQVAVENFQVDGKNKFVAISTAQVALKLVSGS